MINLNELRVGNFVDTVTAYPDYIVVAGIYNGHVCFHDGDMFLPKYVEPLDLTPEWLERFGFEKKEYGEKYTVWAIVNRDNFDFEVVEEGADFHIQICGVVVELKFVHTLQNAFALTGQELELKEVVQKEKI